MQNIPRYLYALLCAILCLTITGVANACTGIQVQATDGAVMFARTLEFGTPLKSNIMFVPTDQSWASSTPDNKKGKTWNNTYAFLGTNILDERIFIDGINEKGLYVGGFWFPNMANYAKPVGEATSRMMAPVDVVSFLLGTCSTLKGVEKAFENIEIVGVKNEQLGIIPPMHWIVIDNAGNAIIIEPLAGEIVIAKNPVGVFTNSPQFLWHLQNLSNYINLSAENISSKKFKEYTATATGEGTGMMGIPGDYTPPSRFVRAALLRNAATPAKTADEALNQAFMLISNVSIAKGIARNGLKIADYTQWTAVYDLQQKRCYFRTYMNQDIRVVHLDTLLEKKDKIVSIPMWDVPPSYKDITDSTK